MKIYDIPNSYLSPDGELWLALAKPEIDDVALRAAIPVDASRPRSIALARSILATPPAATDFALATKVQNSPAVLVFPEYAFGSSDFAELNQLVDAYPAPLIFMAGFGAALGADATNLIATHHLQAGWENQECVIDPNARYNGLWCWVRSPGQPTFCVISFKHSVEQHVEALLVPNFGEGRGHFAIKTNDLTVLPIICSDFVLQRQDSASSLSALHIDGIDDPQRRVLVVSINNDKSPGNNLWQLKIDTFTNKTTAHVAVALCNLHATEAVTPEQVDRFRCLSGVFITTGRAGNPVSNPHPYARRVQTAGSSGYVLRASDAGVACGRIQWNCGGAVNRFVYRPNSRLISEGAFRTEIESPEFIELRRWPKRISIPPAFSVTGRDTISPSIQVVGNAFKAVRMQAKYWPELFAGNGGRLAEDVDSFLVSPAGKAASDHAMIALACLVRTTGLALDFSERRGHLIRHGANGPDTGFEVWSSPSHSAIQQQRTLLKQAQDWTLPYPLRIVARAAGGASLPPQELTTQAVQQAMREADYSADIPDSAPTYPTSKSAPIHYIPYAQWEDILSEAHSPQELAAKISATLENN